jgi:hypothetical protein
MRLLKYINEEWYKRIKGGDSVDVFKNPSRKEFNEIISSTKHNNNSVRFIAYNKTKTLYVWEVYGSIHADMYRALFGGDFQDAVSKMEIIPGIADVPRSGKITMYSSDWLRDLFLGYDSISDINKMVKDFKWLTTYIKIDRYFKDMKNDVNDRQDLTQFNKGL